MAIDTRIEELLTPEELAKLCPGKLHPLTVTRWMTRGIEDPLRRGTPIVLESVLVAHIRYSSARALNAFHDARTAADAEARAKGRTIQQRRAQREAQQKLRNETASKRLHRKPQTARPAAAR